MIEGLRSVIPLGRAIANVPDAAPSPIQAAAFPK
jgi:hypothetical protein